MSIISINSNQHLSSSICKLNDKTIKKQQKLAFGDDSNNQHDIGERLTVETLSGVVIGLCVAIFNKNSGGTLNSLKEVGKNIIICTASAEIVQTYGKPLYTTAKKLINKIPNKNMNSFNINNNKN